MKASITILNGPDSGLSYEIEDVLQIGREQGIDLMIHDTKASRSHAEIFRNNGSYILKDHNSLNGTYLNNNRITTATLSSNDVIQIGSIRLRFTNSNSQEHMDIPPKPTVMSEENQTLTVSLGPKTTEGTLNPALITKLDSAKARALSKRYDTLIETMELVTSSLDLENSFATMAEKMFSVFNANRLAIFVKDQNNVLKQVECLTQQGSSHEGEQIRISRSIANKVLMEKSSVIFQDILVDDRFTQEASIAAMGIQSAMCAPLVQQNEVMGLIYLDSTKSGSAFQEDDLRMLNVIARSVSVAMSNSHFFQEVQEKKEEINKAYFDTVAVLVNTIEARDHYTAGHTWRVTQFSLAIAAELGWTPEKLEELRMAAALHDIGKIGISDTILQKPESLTEEEYEEIKNHPRMGVDILENISFLDSVHHYILHHHERWDGQGYVAGLQGEDIPEGGRIIAVADTFDALTSDRPYRKSMSPKKAISIIKDVSGSQLDPKIVKAFLSVWKAGKIQNIIQKYNIHSTHSVMCPFCSTWINIPSELTAGQSFECQICKRKLLVTNQGKNLSVKLL